MTRAAWCSIFRSPRSDRRLPAAEAPITTVRSGKLPHNGLRLVFEVKGPVTIQTSTLAADRGCGRPAGARHLGARRGVRVAVTPAPVTRRAGRNPAGACAIGKRPRHHRRGGCRSWRRGSGRLRATRHAREGRGAGDRARTGGAHQPGARHEGRAHARRRLLHLAARAQLCARDARKADLFVSIHADSIANPDVSGSSVYVLSERGATSEAGPLAGRARKRRRPQGRHQARRQGSGAAAACCSICRRPPASPPA